MTTQKTTAELLPCPLCNCDKIEHHTWAAFHYGDRGYSEKKEEFTCKGCGLTLAVRGDDVTLEQAVAKWQNRPQADRLAELEAALETIASMHDGNPSPIANPEPLDYARAVMRDMRLVAKQALQQKEPI